MRKVAYGTAWTNELVRMIMRKKLCSIVIFNLLILGCFCFIAEAASLYQDATPMNYMFLDHKARNIGDSLVVIITETLTTSQNASTSTNKTAEQSYNQPTIGRSGKGVNKVLGEIFPFQNGNESTFSGKGTTTRSGSFKGRLSVTVKEILPNGDFVIEGDQVIKVNKETQTVTVSGIVRPVDISPDNTIYSTQVSNAQITLKGKGVIGNTQREGIITRVLNWIF